MSAAEIKIERDTRARDQFLSSNVGGRHHSSRELRRQFGWLKSPPLIHTVGKYEIAEVVISSGPRWQPLFVWPISGACCGVILAAGR
jgi:hypothetical protein